MELPEFETDEELEEWFDTADLAVLWELRCGLEEAIREVRSLREEQHFRRISQRDS